MAKKPANTKTSKKARTAKTATAGTANAPAAGPATPVISGFTGNELRIGAAGRTILEKWGPLITADLGTLGKQGLIDTVCERTISMLRRNCSPAEAVRGAAAA